MTSTTVRFGILGAARIAPAALIRPATSNPEVTVEAVAARDPVRAAGYATRHRIPRVADSYEAIITDPDIDAVYVPLPNSLHAEWTMAALAAGKHVLCEKPFTSNADEAAVVAGAARAERQSDPASSCSRRSTTATIRWPTECSRSSNRASSGGCTTSRHGCAPRSPTSRTSGTSSTWAAGR